MVKPGLRTGTIFVSPLPVVEGIAMIGLPSPSWHRAAPLIKSICPPTPKKNTFSEQKLLCHEIITSHHPEDGFKSKPSYFL